MGETSVLKCADNAAGMIMVVEKLNLCYSNENRLVTRMDDANELYYFRFRMESGGRFEDKARKRAYV